MVGAGIFVLPAQVAGILGPAALSAYVAAGLAVVFIARHRENALSIQCRHNLKQIGEAFRAYHDASSVDKTSKRLPPASIAQNTRTPVTNRAKNIVQGP